MRCWPHFKSKEKVTRSIPHSEIERQQSVNDCLSCMSGNWCVIWSLLYISIVLAAFVRQRESDMLPARSWKWESVECQWFLTLHDCFSKREMVAIVNIQSFDWFFRLKRSWSLSCNFENKLSCDCLGCCRRNISCLSAYKGCQNLVYRYLWSFAT